MLRGAPRRRMPRQVPSPDGAAARISRPRKSSWRQAWLNTASRRSGGVRAREPGLSLAAQDAGEQYGLACRPRISSGAAAMRLSVHAEPASLRKVNEMLCRNRHAEAGQLEPTAFLLPCHDAGPCANGPFPAAAAGPERRHTSSGCRAARVSSRRPTFV